MQPRMEEGKQIELHGALKHRKLVILGDPSKPNYDPEAYEDEAPVHRASSAPYRIGCYPVTVGEYLRFVEAEGYRDESLWAESGYRRWATPGVGVGCAVHTDTLDAMKTVCTAHPTCSPLVSEKR